MQEHEYEVPRYKVRESCIQAGWDFPHESPNPEITLAGEHDCPSCSSRLLEKQTLQVQCQTYDPSLNTGCDKYLQID